ncbi:MAG: indole-3-glycerol phosphate synthase TrpC [Candidatus Omnitrophota bacterium]
MNSILDDIIAYKKERVSQQKKLVSVEDLKQQAQEVLSAGFMQALKASPVNLIAEVKKASPSKGVIRHDFDCVRIARDYARAGAACLSVLTEDKYFQGELSFLKAVKAVVHLPVLCKDFIIDEYQVYESKAAGADAILLIVSVLDDSALKNFYALAQNLKLDVLVEVHSAEEMDRALAVGARMIGINARNLNDFSVDLNVFKPLISRIPKGHIVVCESGMHSKDDLSFVKSLKPDAVLIGEALMRQKDVFSSTREFVRFLKQP